MNNKKHNNNSEIDDLTSQIALLAGTTSAILAYVFGLGGGLIRFLPALFNTYPTLFAFTSLIGLPLAAFLLLIPIVKYGLFGLYLLYERMFPSSSSALASAKKPEPVTEKNNTNKYHNHPGIIIIRNIDIIAIAISMVSAISTFILLLFFLSPIALLLPSLILILFSFCSLLTAIVVFFIIETVALLIPEWVYPSSDLQAPAYDKENPEKNKIFRAVMYPFLVILNKYDSIPEESIYDIALKTGGVFACIGLSFGMMGGRLFPSLFTTYPVSFGLLSVTVLPLVSFLTGTALALIVGFGLYGLYRIYQWMYPSSISTQAHNEKPEPSAPPAYAYNEIPEPSAPPTYESIGQEFEGEHYFDAITLY